MMRRYSYVGPDEIRNAVVTSTARGTPIRAAAELEPFAKGAPSTFVVGIDGILRVADRRSEHVACAGGGEVLSAGELTAVRSESGYSITEVRINPPDTVQSRSPGERSPMRSTRQVSRIPATSRTKRSFDAARAVASAIS